MKRIQSIKEIIGTVHYHHLKNTKLHCERDIIVWLPPSYKKKKLQYPVLYVQDGQNIFDPTTAYIGYDWRVDETATRLIEDGKIKEIIIVGIYNSPLRLLEYSDCETGAKYEKFLIDTIKPFIDSKYRTLPDRHNTAVMGSSMGGLVSFLLVWRHSKVFGKAACLSGSFFWDDDKILDEVRFYKGRKKPVKLYLDCGGREKELIPGYREMVRLLLLHGFKKNDEIEYFLDKTGIHNERSWAKRLWRPLVFLFGKKIQ